VSDTTAVLAVDWGPVGVWAGAIATAFAVIVALLSSLGLFNRYRRARLVITFEPTQPWCRLVELPNGGTDVDPVQPRWAGVPRSISFEPIDIRPGQREYPNVLFQPGFTTQLDINQPHRVRIALFADNTDTIERELPVDVDADRSFDHATRSEDGP
jgi:hypothetical protein